MSKRWCCLALPIFLLLGSGCAFCKYTGNRVADFFDMVSIRPEFGGGAEVRAGPVSVGQYSKTGITGIPQGMQQGVRSAKDGAQLYAAVNSGAVSTKSLTKGLGVTAGSVGISTKSLTKNLGAVETYTPRAERRRQWSEYLEAESHVGAGVGVRVKTSLIGFFDFVGGFFGLDLSKDDRF
jgi:hypothetical protein